MTSSYIVHSSLSVVVLKHWLTLSIFMSSLGVFLLFVWYWIGKSSYFKDYLGFF